MSARKVYKDTIEGVGSNLRRFYKKLNEENEHKSVDKINFSGLMRSELLYVIKNEMERVMKLTLANTEKDKRVIVSLEDVEGAVGKIDINEDTIAAKAVVERHMRELAQDVKDGVKFSKDAMLALQLYMEKKIMKWLEFSLLAAIHAGRKTIMPKDLQLVRTISGERE